jgi:hypothetical protein
MKDGHKLDAKGEIYPQKDLLYSYKPVIESLLLRKIYPCTFASFWYNRTMIDRLVSEDLIHVN